MKSLFFIIILGLGLISGLEMAQAQSDEKPVPEPPYLAPVPDYGHWKVTFKYETEAPATSGTLPAPAPSSSPISTSALVTATKPSTPPTSTVPDGAPSAIETIKTGDLRGITLTFADGTTKEYTCQGNWVLDSTTKGPQLGIATPTAFPYMYYTTGFILLDGVRIDPSTFKSAEKHNGVIAFHYKSGTTDIWIDPTSMLPAGAKHDGVEVSYEFLTPPPRPFPIPKDQVELLQKEQAAARATSSMR